MRTPIDLAAMYGASCHATLRYYVEHHPDAVALLIAGRYLDGNASLPVWNSIQSPSFAARFGPLVGRLPGGLLRVGGDGAPLGDLIDACRKQSDPPRKEVAITDMNGSRKRFVAESWFNQHSVFVMVAEKRATRLGRRVRLSGVAPS